MKSLVIRWKADGVKQCSAPDEKGGYYVLATSLPKGRRASITVKYEKSHFPSINVQENADVARKKGRWRKVLLRGKTERRILRFGNFAAQRP